MGTSLIESAATCAARSLGIAFVTVAMLMLAACVTTFEGHVKPVVLDGQTAQKAALPFGAALVVDTDHKLQRLHVNMSNYRVYPDVMASLSQQLSALFTTVDVFEESQLGDVRSPFLLYPVITTRLDYSILTVTLAWRVVDGATGKTVARFVAEGNSEAQKSFVETLTGRSMDMSTAAMNDEMFSRALNAAALASLSKIRGAVQQRPLPVVAAARPLQPPAAIDSTPPVIDIFAPVVTRGLAVRERSARIAVAGRATDESGVAEVTINGLPATLDASGNFKGDALLKPGANEIVIAATDTRNNTSSLVIQAVREYQAPAQPAISRYTPRKIALLIGIDKYRYIQKLKTAVADVHDIARVLAADYGYETRLLLDDHASRDSIMRELNQLRENLTPDDKLLIYYAGHGVLDQATNASYWLPMDAEPKDDTKWIDSKSISDSLKRMSPRQILVVSDSCYSGTITRSFTAELTKGDVRENYLKKLQLKPSRILISSGGSEPVSDSGGRGHSIFASVFIESLQSPPADVFTAGELVTTAIKESVAGRSAQTPECKIIRNSGHESGDFVFEKIR